MAQVSQAHTTFGKEVRMLTPKVVQLHPLSAHQKVPMVLLPGHVPNVSAPAPQPRP